MSTALGTQSPLKRMHGRTALSPTRNKEENDLMYGVGLYWDHLAGIAHGETGGIGAIRYGERVQETVSMSKIDAVAANQIDEGKKAQRLRSQMSDSGRELLDKVIYGRVSLERIVADTPGGIGKSGAVSKNIVDETRGAFKQSLQQFAKIIRFQVPDFIIAGT